MTHVKAHAEKGMPHATLATVFEVVIDEKVYGVEGSALQRVDFEAAARTLSAARLAGRKLEGDLEGKKPGYMITRWV